MTCGSLPRIVDCHHNLQKVSCSPGMHVALRTSYAVDQLNQEQPMNQDRSLESLTSKHIKMLPKCAQK